MNKKELPKLNITPMDQRKIILSSLLGHSKKATVPNAPPKKEKKPSLEAVNKTNNINMKGQKIKNLFLKSIIAVVVLLTITIIMVLVSSYLFNEKAAIQVTIDYNIGEILAAILGGGGIAIAGIGYAKSKFETPTPDPNQERRD
ncbi:hypothetical protein EMN47_19335 [Prolixibacteraceae bacterium JC049]|nr:hypothetical protein [Prolixibacteraceae bacterium JC049]